jgi:hypothetical protein
MSISSKFERHCGTISQINSCLYEYYAVNKTLYCYNQNGELIEEIRLNEKAHEYLDSSKDGHILFYNDRLLLTSHSKSKFLFF